MHNFFRVLVASAVLGALSMADVSTSHADDLNRRVVVVNDTSYEMVHLYASNVHQKRWSGNDIDFLGYDTILPFDSAVVDFDDGSGYCRYDLQAVFDDNTVVERFNFNVCSEGVWTIYE